jgi:hypothetical protein
MKRGLNTESEWSFSVFFRVSSVAKDYRDADESE